MREKATGTLKFLLNITGEDPEKVCEVLTYEVDADVVLVDGIFNSYVGEFLLAIPLNKPRSRPT